MGANATQGLALVVFLVAFTLLGGAFAAGGSLLWFGLFVVAAAIAGVLFQKAKAWEHQER